MSAFNNPQKKNNAEVKKNVHYDTIEPMQAKIFIIVLTLSIAINGLFTYRLFSSKQQEKTQQAQLPFLSKRIFIENQNDIIINFIPLRDALKKYVEGKDGKVGVYFEYLPSGTSIGVNDKKEVKLASLSKVPLAMSIFKKIERKKMTLADIIIIKKEYLDPRFGNLWEKGEGTQMTVLELLRELLVESDDTAYKALFNQLSAREINEVYNYLDIQIDTDGSGDQQTIVSPKSYTSIFRSLYLSSFLSAEDSNYILKILTQTIFNDKIPAGVNKDVPIAHKIGVFSKVENSNSVFTDCGIVYAPNRPYALCIFVLDTNEVAQGYMSQISKMIYSYVSGITREE